MTHRPRGQIIACVEQMRQVASVQDRQTAGGDVGFEVDRHVPACGKVREEAAFLLDLCGEVFYWTV